MPPPPPPPPPMGGPAPPPPPPPAFGGGGGGGKSSGGGGDRNALLSDIHKGFKLKKTVTNDRSSPLTSNKPSPASNGGLSSGPSNGSSARSPSTAAAAPQGLGGLFSGGIPKLKSTNSKFLPSQPTSSSSASPSPSTLKPVLNGANTISGSRSPDIAATLNKRFASTPQKPEVPKSKSTWNNGSATVSKASNLSPASQTLRSPNKSSPEFEQARSKLTNIFNNSNTDLSSTPSPRVDNSPAPQFTNTNGSSLHRLNTSNKYHTIGPQRKSSSQQALQREEMPAHKGQAPQPPGGGLVKRSNSQTSSSNRPKPSGPKPPSNKPPPPPKHSSSLSAATGRGSAPAPPPPLPPAHQSNGKPPAPPRGSSITEELSNHAQSPSQQNAMARQQFFEQITSPTTPNPPSLSSSSGSSAKMGYNHSHSASQTSLNSRAVRPPSGPPPPPPQRYSSGTTNNNNNEVHKPLKPAPPIPQQIEQLMADSGWTDPAPNPPQRVSSRSLASRFPFAPITSLPAPEQMLNPAKMFPSQTPKPRKPGAPPVPEPPMNGQAGNFLHSAVPHRPPPVSSIHDRKIHINIQRSK